MKCNKIFLTSTPNILVSAFLSLMISLPIMATPMYSITDLGTLGWDNSAAMSISENGLITGSVFDSTGSHVFIGDEKGLFDIGTLGGKRATGFSVNNHGQVVGRSDTANGEQHAFVADISGMTDLGTFGGSWSQANQINNAGQITGAASDQNGLTHAFIGTVSGLKDLGTLGGNISEGTGINDNGQVAGSSALQPNLPTPKGIFLGDETNIESLNAPGKVGSPNLSINNLNQLSGAFVPQGYSDSTIHAFFFDGIEWSDIGTLGGKNSFSKGINNRGQVVGHSHNVNNSHRAFLYDSDEDILFDLNSLVSDLSGWQYLQFAHDINNRGDIVGSGITVNGYQHAFLLKEVRGVSAPNTLSLFIIGLAGIVLFGRKKDSKRICHSLA